MGQVKGASTQKEGSSFLSTLFTKIDNGLSAAIDFLWPFDGQGKELARLPVKSPEPVVASIPDGAVLGVEDDLESLNARISVLENSLDENTSVSITSLDSAGVNLLRNSSFEVESSSKPRQWDYQLDSTTSNTTISKEGNRSGSYGLKFKGGGNGDFGISQPAVKTTPGRTYTLSTYVKAVDASEVTIKAGFWDEYNNKRGTMKDFSFSGNKDWIRINMSATTSGLITDSKNWFPLFEIHGLTSGAIFFDDAQLEEGSVLTAYNSETAKAAGGVLGDGSILGSTGGNLYPAQTGVGSLGLSSNKWEDLFLSDDADISDALTVGGTINANGDVLASDGNLSVEATGYVRIGDSGTPGVATADDELYVLGDIETDGDINVAGTLTVTGAQTFTGDQTITGDLAVNGGDLTTTATTFNLLNATATTISFGGGATTALNIGNGNTAYTAINIGSGTGGNTLNVATGSGNDTVNVGDGTGTNTIDIGGVTSDGTDTINIATSGGANADTIAIGNTNAATTIAITGGDDWSMSAAGVLTLSASAAATTAIVVTDTDYTNAISLGDNIILGTTAAIDFTEFDVSATTGSVTINDGGDAGNVSIEGTVLDINSLDFVGVGTVTTVGALTLDPSTTMDFELTDNTASALTISEGANNYLLITTTNDAEVVTLDLPVGGATSQTLNLGISNIAKTTNIGTGTANDTINLGDAAGTNTIDIAGVTNSGTDTVNIATEGTAADTIVIGNTNASTTLALTGGDDWSMSAAGVLTLSASAAATTAIVITDTDYTNAFSIADNVILGTTAVIDFTDFDVSADGIMTFASDTAGDQITITSPAGDHQSLVVDASTNANTSTAGIIDLNIAAGNAAVDGINIGLTVNDGATAATDMTAAEILLTSNDADADVFGITITAADTANAGSGTYEAGIFIDNADTTAGSMNDGILITSSGVNVGVTDAIDVSATNIDNAINAGLNDILLSTLQMNESGTNVWTVEETGGTDIINGTTTTVQINLSAQIGGTAQRLCHGGADASAGLETVGDCGATQADLAEWYGVTDDSGEGDVVVLDGVSTVVQTDQGSATAANVKKSSTPYESRIIGVISTNPSGEVLGDMVKSQLSNPKAVALSGRVSVKVTGENGAIVAGDYLTTSSIAGHAMKATKAGPVVGMAISDFSGETGTVVAFVKAAWYDPIEEQKRALLAALGVGSYTPLYGQVLGATTESGSASASTATNPLVGPAADGSLGVLAEEVDLLVHGLLTANNLRVTTAAEFAGTLVVKGLATFEGDLVVKGAFSTGSLDLSGALTKTMTAASDLSAGDPVVVAGANTVARAGGPSANVVGLAATSASAGSPVKVAVAGTVGGYSGLATGARYYVGSGGVVTTAPGGDRAVHIGIAISGSEMIVQIFEAAAPPAPAVVDTATVDTGPTVIVDDGSGTGGSSGESSSSRAPEANPTPEASPEPVFESEVVEPTSQSPAPSPTP